MKSKALKPILLAFCAVLLVAVGVVGTLAYFTWSGEVENVFTVGKIGATIDETNVDEYGVALEGSDEGRNEDGGEFIVVPGNTYKKDPVIHITEGSENAWLFVQINNELADLETAEEGKTIDEQMIANGWTWMADQGVYSKLYEKDGGTLDFATFETFTVANDVTQESVHDGSITITVYAVQQMGLADAATAWAQAPVETSAESSAESSETSI